ncbi:MAG: aminopeptidase [Candidatus Woesearchaeota archaeon]
MSSLDEAAHIAMGQCMGLKKKERVLIIYDEKTSEIAESLFLESRKISDKCRMIKISEGKQHGQEPDHDVADEMTKCDVLMLVTTKSLSHTKSRKKSCDKGVRVASMPGITKELMERAVNVDYIKMAERTEKIYECYKENSYVQIKTEKGTDIEMRLMERIRFTKPGIFHEIGDFGNLPAGEADIGPIEGSANGTIVIDASMSGIGKLKNPIKLRVKEGVVVEIKGGSEAQELKKLLEDASDKRAYNIAELGIGTNDKAKISGNVLEDEKVMGTAHVAVGNNVTYGGLCDVPLHLDGVFYKPTIIVDGKKIMQDGKILI